MHIRPELECHVCDDICIKSAVSSVERLGTGVNADVAPGRLGGSDDSFGSKAVQILSKIHEHMKKSQNPVWLA